MCLGACWCVDVCVRSRGEKVSLAPLYYPDTLVNPDTCLGQCDFWRENSNVKSILIIMPFKTCLDTLYSVVYGA